MDRKGYRMSADKLVTGAREMLRPELMALQVAYGKLEIAGFGDGAVILLPPDVAEGFTVIANMPVIRVSGLKEPMLGLPPRAFEKSARPIQRRPTAPHPTAS